MLNELKQEIERSGSDLRAFARRLMGNWVKGTIKLYVIFRSLNYRKENAQLFWDGNYIPLESEGNLKDHVCAFARKSEGKVVLVVVPRFLTRILKGSNEIPLGQEIWGNSRILIPEEISAKKFINIFTGEMIAETKQDGRRGLTLGEIFANFPVALLEKEVE